MARKSGLEGMSVSVSKHVFVKSRQGSVARSDYFPCTVTICTVEWTTCARAGSQPKRSVTIIIVRDALLHERRGEEATTQKVNRSFLVQDRKLTFDHSLYNLQLKLCVREVPWRSMIKNVGAGRVHLEGGRHPSI